MFILLRTSTRVGRTSHSPARGRALCVGFSLLALVGCSKATSISFMVPNRASKTCPKPCTQCQDPRRCILRLPRLPSRDMCGAVLLVDQANMRPSQVGQRMPVESDTDKCPHNVVHASKRIPKHIHTVDHALRIQLWRHCFSHLFTLARASLRMSTISWADGRSLASACQN